MTEWTTLKPQVAEDVLALIGKHPSFTPTQVVVLKLAATLLAEDETGWSECRTTLITGSG